MLEPRTMNYLEILERIRDVVLQNMELETKLKDSNEIEWNKHLETFLFYAMRGLKPVGVNRYFMMTVIHNRFSTYISKELSSKLIWDHLESLYDMAALHESEIIPFPNEEVDFELPEEVDEMVKEKYGIILPRPPKEENLTPKSNSNLKTVKKLSASKLKQSTNATANAKNAFQTPVSSKSSKNHLGSRSEPRPPSAEITVKGKQESQFPARVNKVNRASSPFTTKNMKSETSSSTSESSTATPVSTSKKSNKTENHNSSSGKKTPKSESTPSSNTLKKYAKTVPHSSSSKHAKTETPDNYNKKVRTEKEQSNKKGKVSLPAENSTSKKSSKSDVKKTETEHNHKKSSDTSTSKPKAEKERGSSKGSKYDDLESTHPSGSRKSSSAKVDTSEKKKKRQRVEESAKKGTPPAKRRRTLNT